MKNKEKYDLTKLDLIIQGNLLKLFDKDNAEKLFESEWQSYIVLTFNLLKWLEQEYIEPIKLTEDEKVILKNLDKKYQYIVRNQNGNLKVCNGNVEKCDGRWVNCNYFHYFCLFDHLFQFIKWEDEKPYNIDELLKQNGVER